MNRVSYLVAASLGLIASQAAAQGDPAHCGDCGCFRYSKICRVVCDTKKDVTFTYQLKCEDVSLPGPSQCCGTKCVSDERSWRGFHFEPIWRPRCGCIRQQRKLVKVAVVKETPSYKYIVERVCRNCGCSDLDVEETDLIRSKNPPPTSDEPPVNLDDEPVAGLDVRPVAYREFHPDVSGPSFRR